ncbi:MAG TPA: acetate/propionate family kinase [Gaiellaceae bacterium]|nr:acetate/propionate family kinase [Gaiellaceae bacterium]
MAALNDVFVVNAGSTSLKLSVVSSDDFSEKVASLESAPHDVDAVAHRVVHGGERFCDAVVVDEAVERELAALTELAPLHNRPALDALADARRVFPDVPHVAVFDTAFHATIPAEASTYAVPQTWRDEWAIRRFGFHGLSVDWCARRVPVPRLAVCHLGGGCSVSAVLGGRSVDTTMGFSPLDGVPMATRSGSIDPEIVLHLLRTKRLGIEELERALESESGLLGISGESSRVEKLETSASADAALALAVFAHRIAGAVAAMASTLGGLDAIVFTGGTGERSGRVRADVCGRLEFLGCALDERANESAVPDAVVSMPDAPVAVHVIRAREDVVAADAARRLLS